MGLTCSLHRASEREIDRLIAEPDAVPGFLYPDDGSTPRVREVRPKGVLGWLLRLTPITIEEVVPDDGDPERPPPDPDRSIDIDKGWNGLHFLFTGTADEGEEPACYLVRGGEELDEGQARALRPDQVRRWAAYLEALTPAELARRYDPARMTELEIYPDTIWNRPPSAETPLSWLTGCHAQLRQFVNRAAACGDGLIINIS
jgi:hypothetical protein